MTQSPTKRLAFLSVFAALSLGIYALESFIPNPIPIPGIKLGLANIITLVVFKKYGFRDAALVLIVRILLSALLFGSLYSMLYSLTGGALCLAMEYVIDRFLKGKAIYVTGIFGAIFHNAGQVLVAFLITSLPQVWIYIPYLLVAAIITGFITGMAAHFTLKLLNRLPVFGS